MDQPQFSDGDLLAHLDGEKIPRLEEVLRTSDELQHRLDELRALDDWLYHNFDGIERPDPNDLVDVALEQASSRQKLVVATYTRNSVPGQRELEMLQKKATLLRGERPEIDKGLGTSLPKGKKPEPIKGALVSFSWLAPHPIGVRRASLRESRMGAKIELLYEESELHIEIRIQIVRPGQGELWKIIGAITQNEGAKEAISDAQVALQSKRGGRARQYTTDATGYFAFYNVKQNSYQLKINLAGQTVSTPDFDLKEFEA